MRTLLHILTESDCAFANEIIAKQKANPGNKIEVVDLNEVETDYKLVLEKIFAADSVQVW